MLASTIQGMLEAEMDDQLVMISINVHMSHTIEMTQSQKLCKANIIFL